jgi:hypothetical protein
MKLVPSSCESVGVPTPLVGRTIRRAFEFFSKELELDSHEGEVQMRFCNCIGAECRGSTGPSTDLPNARVVVATTQSVLEVIDTIAHEMVHVSQQVHGRLVDKANEGAEFMGELIPREQIKQLQKGDPRELPYEAEAYARQPVLYRAFLDTLSTDELLALAKEPRMGVAC